MKPKTVHLHPDKLAHKRNIYLLLIPTLIFAFILFALFLNFQDTKNKQIATSSEPSVLGEEANENH